MQAEHRFASDLKEYQEERIEHWENALTMVKQNTPGDSVIIAWWDYGYAIQGISERATIADPGGGGKRREDLAKIFTSPENKAIGIIEKYVQEGTPVYIIVSFEEFMLANQISHDVDGGLFFYEYTIEKSGFQDIDERSINEFIETNEIESYAIENIGRYWRIWFTGFIPEADGSYTPDPKMNDKLLPKLLPFNTGAGKGLKNFKLVYKDNSNFIFIYQKI